MRKAIIALAGAVLLIVLLTAALTAAERTVCSKDCEYDSLADAIAAAGDGDTIRVSGTITESGIVVDKELVIVGTGAKETVIGPATAECAADAANKNRVFIILGDPVMLRDLTVRHGCVNGATITSSKDGGGILNSGDLRLERVVIRDNSVVSTNGRGGGIYNLGRLTLTQSVLLDNSAAGDGGGLYNRGFVAAIRDSTVSNNAAGARGGGIFNFGFISTRQTTIFNNSSAADGNADIYNGSEAEFLIANSIVRFCTGKELLVAAKTLAIAEGCGLEVASGPLVAGLERNATLPFHPLRRGAAFDAIDCSPTPVKIDQIGTPRPQGAACDLGAVELPLKMFPIVHNPVPKPDLRILDLKVHPLAGLEAGDAVTLTVVIQNSGLRALKVEDPDQRNFWLDLYINPRQEPPNQAGTTWPALCPGEDCLGLAWRVTRALQPGEVMTLTSTYVDDNLKAILDPGQSKWDGEFKSGGEYVLWAFIDSWGGPNQPRGWVRDESNERNNRFGPVRFFVNECDCEIGSTPLSADAPMDPRPLPSKWQE